MNRMGRATVMLAVGTVLVRLLWNGGFGWFVQQRMRWPLIGAAAVLCVFGLYEAISDARHSGTREGADTGSRPVGPGVGWLLGLPIIVLVLVAPTGLGAAAADRVDAYQPVETAGEFPPIDDSDGPVEMRVFDFLDRAAWDPDRSLEGITVRLEGLVVNDDEVTDGFKLTKFLVSCCAADGIPLQVVVHGAPPIANDTWVVADVIWREPEVPYIETPGDWVIEADAVEVTVVDGDVPKDPYESPY